MSTEPQGPWAKAMEKVGAADPRNGRPSWNALAELSGVGTSTITLMVSGRRRPSVSTITKIAEALRVDPDVVRGWLRNERPVTVYQVPDEVHLLTPRQQKALTEFIRAIAVEQEGGGSGGDTTATKEPQELRSVGPYESGSGQAAARRVKGGSAGQRSRAAQDYDAEGSQDPDD